MPFLHTFPATDESAMEWVEVRPAEGLAHMLVIPYIYDTHTRRCTESKCDFRPTQNSCFCQIILATKFRGTFQLIPRLSSQPFSPTASNAPSPPNSSRGDRPALIVARLCPNMYACVAHSCHHSITLCLTYPCLTYLHLTHPCVTYPCLTYPCLIYPSAAQPAHHPHLAVLAHGTDHQDSPSPGLCVPPL